VYFLDESYRVRTKKLEKFERILKEKKVRKIGKIRKKLPNEDFFKIFQNSPKFSELCDFLFVEVPGLKVHFFKEISPGFY